MSATKRVERVPVKLGQVWRDCDGRMNRRHVLVVEFGTGTFREHVYCVPCTEDGRQINSRRTRIAIARMYPHSTGYEFVSEQTLAGYLGKQEGGE